MKFVKKLYIMTGGDSQKGAVTVEKNAFGTYAELNVGASLYLKKCYFAFVSDRVLVFEMGGRNRFDLGDVSLSPAHVAVVSLSRGELRVELYGTDGGKRMWQSNLLDLVRGKINDFEKTPSVEKIAAQDPREKTDEKGLSLFPVSGDYDDGAIAKVNYYSNMYSSREKTPFELKGERSRLEELGGNLVQAKMDVDEACRRGHVSEQSFEEEAVIDAETERAEPMENSGAAEADREAVAAVAEKTIPAYGRYLYAYRDSMLRRNIKPAEAEEKPYSAYIRDVAKMQSSKEPQKPENAEDAPSAPKSDLSKSERAFAETTPVKLNFYERIKSNLDKLFEDNERDTALEKLLPQSEFVRIAVENSDKYYCVGIVGKPDYICYAVPAEYTPEPPEELDGYCQWLPSDSHEPKGRGYWLIYQDAVSGESVGNN